MGIQMDLHTAITGITALNITFLLLIGIILVHGYRKGIKKAGV